MTARRPAIAVHIEHLVVDGLPLTAAQAVRMQASLERELARLIAQGGNASAWGGAQAARSAAPAPGVPWDATRPHQLGRALARDVFASLNGPSNNALNGPANGPANNASPQAAHPRGRS
jgi:hypothetical protein